MNGGVNFVREVNEECHKQHLATQRCHVDGQGSQEGLNGLSSSHYIIENYFIQHYPQVDPSRVLDKFHLGLFIARARHTNIKSVTFLTMSDTFGYIKNIEFLQNKQLTG